MGSTPVIEGNRVWGHYLPPDLFKGLCQEVHDLVEQVQYLERKLSDLVRRLTMMSTIRPEPSPEIAKELANVHRS